MKHIKPYKIFESSSSEIEICGYLKDILQELVDVGFTCGVWYGAKYLDLKKLDIVVNISKGGKKPVGFFYIEIEDYVYSTIDYMDSMGYKIDKETAEDGYIADFRIIFTKK